MPGAGPHTVRVDFVNLNWNATEAPGRGEIQALLVTEDGTRHVLALNADDVAGFLAMVRASPVLLFDPDATTVIAANIVGEWLPAEYSALDSA